MNFPDPFAASSAASVAASDAPTFGASAATCLASDGPAGTEAQGTHAAILAEITAGLAHGVDIGDLLARFLEPIVRMAGADAGGVRVISDDGRSMNLVASRGLPVQVLEGERQVATDCGACGAARASGLPVWDQMLSTCAARHAGLWFGTGCHSVLAVPLRHRSRVLGVYNLFYLREGHASAAGRALPDPQVQGLLEIVGDLLGLALENARLERENLRATVAASLAQERRALAADLHDSIGQSLAFVKMRLPLLHDAIEARERADAERYFDDVHEAVGQAHASLRAILTHFRTPMDPLGLAHALRHGVAAFERESGVSLSVINEAPELRLDPEREAQVFHVVREALSNVSRHAAARHAWVRIAQVDAAQVEVNVEDDGQGLRVAQGAAALAPAPEAAAAAAAASAVGTSLHGARSHYGMDIMRERARRLGGTLHVAPREGGGTGVRLRFPLTPATTMPSAPTPAPLPLQAATPAVLSTTHFAAEGAR